MKYSTLVSLSIAIFLSCSPSLAEEDSGPLSFPEWQPISTEYTRAQTSDWLDADRFAVGRWDGSISVFRKPMAGEFTPVLVNLWRTHDGTGVEMLYALDTNTLIATNGKSSLAVWTLDGSKAQIDLSYDPKIGVANSAITLTVYEKDFIVTGHEFGQILFWRKDGSSITFDRSLDLASANPIPSPYPLKNIRGLAVWRGTHIVAGSEDGDLTIIDPATDTITLRQRYNVTAERGINSISAVDDYILLANCSVGRNDKNLWLFKIDAPEQITLVDAIDLKDDLSRKQSFNFDADLIKRESEYQFYASTEEGFLWAGVIEEDKLMPRKTAFVASDGGALLDFNEDQSTLLAAARKIYLFDPL